jgi:2'-5' RNA ligase
MRAFLGLSPDANTKFAIDVWRNDALPNLETLVPAANFHVTLAFLGNITTGQLEVITRLIDEMPKITAFDVSLDRLGYWPKPKAFWLGCQHTANEHLTLVKQTHEMANKSGMLLHEQDYVAHLTLARKCTVNPPAPTIPANFQWRADKFHLFESKSSPQGVYYPIIQSWPMY